MKSTLEVGRSGLGSLAESGQKTLKVGFYNMGSAAGNREGPFPSRIFIDGTDKVEGGLMVLFFGIVFPVGRSLGKFSADALDSQLPCFTFSIKKG